MSFSVASSLPFGLSRFQDDVICCSTSCGCFSNGKKTAFERCRATDPFSMSFRSKNTYIGSARSRWLLMGYDLYFSKASVAADYSDSVPDSSNYVGDHGYHPLEELKVCRRTQDHKLSSAEIARTTVEANSSALLVFPGTIHAGLYEQVSWAEFPYVIDDYGDIFFEIYDNENLLKDPGARNPVNALVGMDFTMYEKKRMSIEYVSEFEDTDEIPFEDYYLEVLDLEPSEALVDWGTPVNSGWVHPLYFSKCLQQSVNVEYERDMDHPRNAVAMLSCLRPVFDEEESYLRGLFHFDNRDDCFSDDTDEGSMNPNTSKNGSQSSSIIYQLEIKRIELFSVYGVQSSISLDDFQDAEPDVLANLSSKILERLSKQDIICNGALKALCRKKGLIVEYESAPSYMVQVYATGSIAITTDQRIAAEILFKDVSETHMGATLIGFDSLGLDVRVYSGREVQTHRFPFKVKATSEMSAEKQIRKLLYPRSRQKKFRADNESRD